MPVFKAMKLKVVAHTLKPKPSSRKEFWNTSNPFTANKHIFENENTFGSVGYLQNYSAHLQ